MIELFDTKIRITKYELFSRLIYDKEIPLDRIDKIIFVEFSLLQTGYIHCKTADDLEKSSPFAKNAVKWAFKG